MRLITAKFMTVPRVIIGALILFSIYAALRLARLVVTPASDLKSEI